MTRLTRSAFLPSAERYFLFGIWLFCAERRKTKHKGCEVPFDAAWRIRLFLCLSSSLLVCNLLLQATASRMVANPEEHHEDYRSWSRPDGRHYNTISRADSNADPG